MPTKTYVIGHRNPDPDSIAAAVALAALRRRAAAPGEEIVAAGRTLEDVYLECRSK